MNGQSLADPRPEPCECSLAETDKRVALHLRERTIAALAPLAELQREAAKAGMLLNWQMTYNRFGEFEPVVQVLKELT